MRLLKLPSGVLDLIGEGKLGFSEARVLLEAAAHLDAEGLVKFAQDAVDRDWTVKELNAHVSRLKNPLTDASSTKEEKRIDPNVADAERRLRESLGLHVQVVARSQNQGKVLIRYESIDDFDRILESLARN
jgi:ParB-like chromosome segregation protein Spo0J